MSIDEFVAEYNNQFVKSPNGIIGQCVSVSSEWAVQNNWPELRGATAYEIFQNFNDPAYLRISPSLLLPGDIGFFGPNYGNGDGHTGVVTSVTPTTVNLFEQNDPDGSPAHVKTYNRTDLIGGFHPVGETLTMTPDVQAKFDELDAKLVDIKNWELNLFRALVGSLNPDQVNTNLYSMLQDIKQWELNIDKDVKDKPQAP